MPSIPKTSAQKKTSALIILDGWGSRQDATDNAITSANTPCWNNLINNHPNTLLDGSGEAVGLPEGQMGNSEVGHMSIGSGRVVYQDLTRINKAIESGAFGKNPVISQTLNDTLSSDKSLHIIGLLSDGGVHSHQNHIEGLIKEAKKRGLQKIYLHAITDGRDTAPKCAAASLEKFEALLKGSGGLATVIGRFYALDRDNRWDRAESAYHLWIDGKSEHVTPTAAAALQAAYERDETDEFVTATVVEGVHKPIEDGDSIIFMNFRADRARQIVSAATDPEFTDFARSRMPEYQHFVTLTEYAKGMKVEVAYAPEVVNQTLGEQLSTKKMTQLRIAETEKYAHVTFFFNGGVETVFPGEERILIPSPSDVRTYDEKPEMSAFELTEKFVAAIESQKFDAIICNFANTDMVGHTGNFKAAQKAVETVDSCLAQITSALKKVGGQCLITADHGNAETMVNAETGEPHTSHTCELVPLVYFGPQEITFKGQGTLADIAPTFLSLISIPQPDAMSGNCLVSA